MGVREVVEDCVGRWGRAGAEGDAGVGAAEDGVREEESGAGLDGQVMAEVR